MSTNDKTSSAPTKTRMTGAEVLVECLVREGVDVVFAYPGGASMPIHQALSHQPKIRTILPRHEQGGAFGAEGYGRVTGKVGLPLLRMLIWTPRLWWRLRLRSCAP